MSRNRRKSSCLTKLIVVPLILIVTVMILLTTGVFDKLQKKAEEVIYPLRYREEILKASEDYDLPPEFISAVIYTESKFNEKAQSSAGAKGLMQLLPETFSWLQTLRGETDESLDIFDPAANIDYGCYYIAYLRDRYSDPYTAMAAYNAGHSRVDKWLEEEQYSDDGKTLISIPFEETSDYVERIRNAEAKYKKLYFS